MLHHADELRLRMAAEHEAATRGRLSPEVDQRCRATAPAEQKRAKSGPGRCEGQAAGAARESAIGWPIAAILARSIDGARTGAVVRKSGASSAESAIQDKAPASWAAITTSAGREGDPNRAVGPPPRQKNNGERGRVGGLQKKLRHEPRIAPDDAPSLMRKAVLALAPKRASPGSDPAEPGARRAIATRAKRSPNSRMRAQRRGARLSR